MNQPRSFLRWVRLGQHYGYPKCCVLQFARECLEGKEPARLRGTDPTGRYVPCSDCRVNHHRPLNSTASMFCKLLEAAEHAYKHLDTYGTVTGGHEQEMASQQKAFDLLRPAIDQARTLIGNDK